ncbi:hypothetical protein GZH53_16605 [Flavihumibacter sp. R14]|nr:hypothetical protein [Flavihumibacter soli]
MRYTPLLILVFFSFSFNTKSYSQAKNRLTIQTGFASNALFTSANLAGGPSHEGKGASAFGLMYSRSLSRSFALETGLEYSLNKIETTSAFHPGFERITTKNQIEMISLPFYGNFTFLKYLFVNGGLMLDLETKISGQEFRGIDSQSGLGYGLGAGGKYSFKKMTVVVNPFFQKHGLLPFEGNDYQERLGEMGVKFGVGYNF